MSYHIVSIDSPQCSLSCRDGQLVYKNADGEKSLPLEDVASIIITSFSASIHSHLFLEAAKHGVALIICESFKPVSLVLPANRSTDTLLSRAILNLSEQTRAALWAKTIDAKCGNQFSLARFLAPEHSSLGTLERTAGSRKPHKEGICAKVYWEILSEALGEEEFTRHRGKGGLNDLLNYGYAVLLSTVLQKIFGVGLDPTFGMAHVARERSTPLAYDLMEPFRPCVDWRVAQWVMGGWKGAGKKAGETSAGTGGTPVLPGLGGSPFEVTKEFRKWVTGFPLVKLEYRDGELDVVGCIEGVVRTFRHAVLENSPRAYKPWIQRSSKWAG